MNELPVLDPQPLRDLLELGASPALVQELISLYQEDVPVRVGLLQSALCARDGGQVAQEAHQLKGALGNLGLVRFAGQAAHAEILARQGRLEELIPLVEALPTAYREALAALKAAFPET